MMRFGARLAAAGLALALALGPGAGWAQDFGGAFGGFNRSSDQPIQIEADRLEVRDVEKIAIYTGNVRVRQGDTLMEAPEMRVFYEGEATTDGSPGSDLSRIEAGPDVVVTSLDQTASGDGIVIDMRTDLITMTGNVVLTQGTNVVRGEKLVVNMVTNEGQMEGGRVQTLITPSGGRPAQ